MFSDYKYFNKTCITVFYCIKNWKYLILIYKCKFSFRQFSVPTRFFIPFSLNAAKGKVLDASQEMVAVGLCNIIGSMFGSYPVNASFSRAAVGGASGVKTPLAGIYTGRHRLSFPYNFTLQKKKKNGGAHSYGFRNITFYISQ